MATAIPESLGLVGEAGNYFHVRGLKGPRLGLITQDSLESDDREGIM